MISFQMGYIWSETEFQGMLRSSNI